MTDELTQISSDGQNGIFLGLYSGLYQTISTGCDLVSVKRWKSDPNKTILNTRGRMKHICILIGFVFKEKQSRVRICGFYSFKTSILCTSFIIAI